MAYSTVANVRLLSNLTTGDISDADVTSLIAFATSQLNSDVNTKVTRERVRQIDNTRRNQIDGSNTTYYVQNWEGKFLGDSDNDGDVDTSDIIVYQVAADGTETTLTVSSVTHDEGKFVLDSAPSSGVRLFVDYDWCKKDESTPDNNILHACTYLTISLSFQKVYRGLSPQQVYGNVRLMVDMKASDSFFKLYQNIVSKINSGEEIRWAEAEIF